MNNLRNIRLKNKLSLAKLSEMSGVSKSVISGYENNLKDITLTTARRLVKALKITLNEL